MTDQAEPAFDLFISYAEADREWVEGFLLPRLQQAALKIIYEPDFVLGVPRIENIERAILQSRHTAVILTPEWFNNEWNIFEGLLVRTLDPAARRRRLLGLLLKPCQLPPSLVALQQANFTQQKYWDRECTRLIRDIQRTKPVPPPWETVDGLRSGKRWREWLWRYQRELRRVMLVLGATWLILAIVLEWAPFQQRRVWIATSRQNFVDAWRMFRSGDTLLIGGRNNAQGCTQSPQGIWRSEDDGAHWQAIDAPVEYPDSAHCQYLAGIMGFAASFKQPHPIYATTDEVGLLFSNNDGRDWQSTNAAKPELRQLTYIAVNPNDHQELIVASKGGGLYRSPDGGQSWQRLDRASKALPVCPQGTLSFGKVLLVGALNFAEQAIIVGTGDPHEISADDVPGGLYRSVDHGHCWQQIDDGADKFEYQQISYIAQGSVQQLVFFVKDWEKDQTDETFKLYLLNLSGQPSMRKFLWKYAYSVPALITLEHKRGAVWYAIDGFGRIYSGAVDTPAQVEQLPRLWWCSLIICHENAAWIAEKDVESPPLLLAANQVYRLQPGPWWRQFWP